MQDFYWDTKLYRDVIFYWDAIFYWYNSRSLWGQEESGSTWPGQRQDYKSAYLISQELDKKDDWVSNWLSVARKSALRLSAGSFQRKNRVTTTIFGLIGRLAIWNPFSDVIDTKQAIIQSWEEGREVNRMIGGWGTRVVCWGKKGMWIASAMSCWLEKGQEWSYFDEIEMWSWSWVVILTRILGKVRMSPDGGATRWRPRHSDWPGCALLWARLRIYSKSNEVFPSCSTKCSILAWRIPELTQPPKKLSFSFFWHPRTDSIKTWPLISFTSSIEEGGWQGWKPSICLCFEF